VYLQINDGQMAERRLSQRLLGQPRIAFGWGTAGNVFYFIPRRSVIQLNIVPDVAQPLTDPAQPFPLHYLPGNTGFTGHLLRVTVQEFVQIGNIRAADIRSAFND